MIAHAWRGYEEHAFGFDELRPVAKVGDDTFGGLGATPVDAFDTLHMAGLTAQAEK